MGGEGEEGEGGDAEGGDAEGEVEASLRPSKVSSSRKSRLSGASAPSVLMTPEQFASERELASLRPEFRPIFLNFNLTMKKFITFEIAVHKMWVQNIGNFRGGLKCPILVRDPGEFLSLLQSVARSVTVSKTQSVI